MITQSYIGTRGRIKIETRTYEIRCESINKNRPKRNEKKISKYDIQIPEEPPPTATEVEEATTEVEVAATEKGRQGESSDWLS
jgi:hypothetical protein